MDDMDEEARSSRLVNEIAWTPLYHSLSEQHQQSGVAEMADDILDDPIGRPDLVENHQQPDHLPLSGDKCETSPAQRRPEIRIADDIRLGAETAWCGRDVRVHCGT